MRKRVSVPTLRKEAHHVLNFCLNHLPEDPKGCAAISEIFGAYKVWLKRQKFSPTALSVDGFGRLLPKFYKRKYMRVAGKVKRMVVGVNLT